MHIKRNGLTGLSLKAVLAGPLLSCISSSAFADQNYTLLAAEAGYRVDQLDWNIGGVNSGRTDQYVNVLSELTWRDVKIRQAALQLDSQDKNGFGLRWRVSFGKVFEGDNQDSDFDYDNRQGEFSRSNNEAGGDVSEILIGMAKCYQGQWRSRAYYLTPALGYSLSRQNFEMRNGFQALFVPTPGGAPDPGEEGPIAGLNSTYDTKWETLWFGVDVGVQQTDRLHWLVGMKFHAGDLTARANWNLRSDFAHPLSFEHWADGYGVATTLGGQYKLTADLSMSVTLDYQSWNTDRGVDRVYFSSGSSIDTPLNEVNWESTAINVGLIWRRSH